MPIGTDIDKDIDKNIDLSGIPKAPDPGVDLSGIPKADLQNSQAEAKSMMGEAWRTCQEVGNVYPMAEAASHFITGIAGGSLAGLGGLFSLPFVGPDGAKSVIETINEWLVYQPQTKAGTSLSETALYPLKKLEQAGSALGDEVMKRSGNPYLATAVYTAVVGAPALIGLRSLPKAIQGKIKESTAWRQMNIKERGLVFQGLEETIRKNPEMTEGAIIRRWNNLRDEAMARRAEGEKVAPIRKVERVKAYHGTGSTSTGTAPMWFSANRKLAKKYADAKSKLKGETPSVSAVSLSMENPIEITVNANDNITASKFREITGIDFKLGKYADEIIDGVEQKWKVNTLINSSDFIEKAEKAGYDGIKIKEGESDTLAVFNQSQITPDLKPIVPRETPADKFNQEVAEFVRKETDLSDAEINVVFLGGEEVVKAKDKMTAFHGSPKAGITALKEGLGGEYQRVAGIYATKSKKGALKYTKIKGKTQPENVYTLRLDLKNPASREILDEIGYGKSGTEMRQILKDKGFDSVVDDLMDEIVIFDKSQVEIVLAEAKPPSTDFKDHITGYLEYMTDLVKQGEAGKRVRVTDLDGTEQWVGVASTYPDFMRDQNLTGKEVETALNKAIKGQKLTDKQVGIVQNALEQAQEMFLREVEGMPKGDLAITKEPASIDVVSRALAGRNVKGDDLLDAQDLYQDLIEKGGQIDEKGMVTLYHRTTHAQAAKIVKDQAMMGKEDRLFFGTHPRGQIDGYGEAVIQVTLPLEKLALNDVFSSEVHVTYKVGKPGILVKMKAEVPGTEFAKAEASINKAIEQLFKMPELIKATKAHLAKVRKAMKPRKGKPTKKQIRETTGQIKISKMVEGLTERTALADQIRFEVRAARDAYRAGKLEETIKHKNKAISLYRRRERLRAIRDHFVIPENIMKKLTKGRDIGLMSDWEFKQYKDALLLKAVEMTKQAEAKSRLMHSIAVRNLKRVDNYRKALELPPIGKMTIKQLEEFEALLEPFADGDVFLTERELETVDRTDLEGIRTWREARESLAKETGVPVEELEKTKITELDEFRYDTALAKRNPFLKMLVSEVTRKGLEADARYYMIEQEALDLARKAQQSRPRTLMERAIPQEKKIFEYMETPEDLKVGLAQTMTIPQLHYAHFIYQYFSHALEYLIKIQALTKGRENYFVHMRRTFLEEVKESGIVTAFERMFKNMVQDEAVFTILDEDTGNILPFEKFFQFTMHRSGELLPTQNVTKAFLAYVKMFERKVSYDELIPKMDIYAQSITPQVFTPKGLEVDRTIKKFVYKYINNKKGRRIRWMSKQNGKIDMTIRAVKTFTTLLDLGLNIPVSVASMVGEQATGLQGLGVKKYALGIKRLQTAQGKKIVDANKAFIGKSVFAELAEPGKIVTERFMEGIFALFRVATVTANKQYLLGSLTKQEFETGKIDSKRLAEMKIDMGRWRKVTGANSIVGSTAAGGAGTQYKTWAVPILSTTLRDIKIFSKDMKAKGLGEALKTREAKELWRFFLIGSFVAIVGSMIAAEKDDRSFIGQMKAKAYRELNTLMQGVGPGLWLSVPRISVFAKQLGTNLQDILTMERYKTKPGLKGVEGLKRQLTPVVVKQFTREKKTKRVR